MTTQTIADDVFVNLSKTDRCDRCGAQAVYRVVLPSTNELFFCNHHASKHLSALTETALYIQKDNTKI